MQQVGGKYYVHSFIDFHLDIISLLLLLFSHQVIIIIIITIIKKLYPVYYGMQWYTYI